MNFAFLNDPPGTPFVPYAFLDLWAGSSTTNYIKKIDTGTSWTSVSGPTTTTNSFNNITCKPNSDVLIVWDGTKNYKRSTDGGVTFSSETSWPVSPSWAAIRSVAYGNGAFVAIGTNGNVFYSTDDGANWTAGTLAQSNNMQSCVYGSHNGRWVAVSNNGTNRVQYSTDNGATWTTGSIASNTWYSITYDESLDLFLACSTSGTSRIYSSSNGSSWTARDSTANIWYSITTDNAGKCVCIGMNGTNMVVKYSTNGTSWTAGTGYSIGSTYNSISNVVYTGSMFLTMIGERSGSTYYLYGLYSTDGTNFSTATGYPVTPQSSLAQSVIIGTSYRG